LDEKPGRTNRPGAPAWWMTQLAQQMREMADRMLTGGLPGWTVPGITPAASTGSGGTGGAAATAEAASGGSGARSRGLPAIPGMPPMPGLSATPATMSARQLQAVVDDIAARRSQVQALVASLTAFDEQLGTLENSLRPLLQWLRTWSDMESAVTDFWTP